MKIVAKEADKSPIVRGTTNINHNIRARLNISVAAYCLIDFYTGWYANNNREPQIGDIYLWLGINDGSIVANINSELLGKKMCTEDFRPTEKWTSCFGNDNEFNELWTIHAKGNKKTAKQRFAKAIKKIRFKDLKDKLKAYAASNDFQYLKGLDVWLNPDKEHWNDPIVPKQQGKAQPAINHNFFGT